MIIKAHSVPTDASTGLSPMQTCLLHSDQPVRLVAAPTGTGKSFGIYAGGPDTLCPCVVHRAHAPLAAEPRAGRLRRVDTAFQKAGLV